ncbi:hypothetical protein [Streptomyces sp. NPDC005017]|uniref:hypothetical protein n=1 Tax=Streptomyces sp. NPDC005017 TaxID=3364706 RepID=UPI0036AF74BA
MTHPFPGLAPLGAARFTPVGDRVARLLDTRQDVVIMQGEAPLPPEGAIRDAAPVATTLRVADGRHAAKPVARAPAADPGVPPAAGGGAPAAEMIRVNHYGADAPVETARRSLAAPDAAAR